MPFAKPIPALSEEQAARFWSRVERGTTEQCWPWRGAKNQSGYGQFFPTPRKSPYLAHRVAFFLSTGSIDDELLVRHVVCDNRLCCNHSHLTQGTNADNARDRRGKPLLGKRIAHLAMKQDTEVAMAVHHGESVKSVASRFDCSPSVVLAALKRHGINQHWAGKHGRPRVQIRADQRTYELTCAGCFRIFWGSYDQYLRGKPGRVGSVCSTNCHNKLKRAGRWPDQHQRPTPTEGNKT